MKLRRYGTGVKLAAVVLLLLSFLAAFWSMLGVGYMVNEGYYRNGYTFSKTELCKSVTRDYADTAFYNYFLLTQQAELDPHEAAMLTFYRTEFTSVRTNFVFRISDASGKTLLTNDDDLSRQYERTYLFSASELPDTGYSISCSVREPLSAEDAYIQPYAIFRTLYQARYALIAAACVSLLVSVCLFAYLMLAAGRRGSGGELVEAWQHKIPLDVFTAGLMLAGFLAFKVMTSMNLPGNAAYGFLTVIPISFILLLLSLIALAFCMNLAVQIKTGKWLKNTVVYLVVRFIFRCGRTLFAKLPMIWKSAFVFAGYLFLNALLTAVAVAGRASAGRLFLWFIFNLAVFAALCYLMLKLKTLKHAGERIAAGDYVTQVDTAGLAWDLKHHAENLNNIVGGMSRAVEERLKSERLKTELITNVSHDLKTPLTAIISYIDLLKKESLGNEKVNDYIAVLDRQSNRLKKLTEDLLEASKAATGNISISFERTDLIELLNQSVGEYAERFEESRLEAVFNTGGDDKAYVKVDGRLLWRVFDNLLNNICKYALAGTRVYISVEAGADITAITLLNISRDRLNVASSELMERFVRGDVSRSTEGSGLGLSISKSLTELMGGSFELRLEGDLFKTVLTFRTLV